jgi:hypothetical protein
MFVDVVAGILAACFVAYCIRQGIERRATRRLKR